jgi:hypothetical protein
MYYPRVPDLIACVTTIPLSSWTTLLEASQYRTTSNRHDFERWLSNVQWTSTLKIRWQEFFNQAARQVYVVGDFDKFQYSLERIPNYEDLKQVVCNPSLLETLC